MGFLWKCSAYYPNHQYKLNVNNILGVTGPILSNFRRRQSLETFRIRTPFLFLAITNKLLTINLLHPQKGDNVFTLKCFCWNSVNMIAKLSQIFNSNLDDNFDHNFSTLECPTNSWSQDGSLLTAAPILSHSTTPE